MNYLMAASFMDWLSSSGSDTVVQGLVSILVMAILYGMRKMGIEKKAMEAIEEGMEHAQEEFVVWKKRASADGKLSKEERTEARELATKHAKSIATGPAGKLLASWAKEKIGARIQRILNKKGKKSGSNPSPSPASGGESS